MCPFLCIPILSIFKEKMKKKKLFHCVVSVRLNKADKERLDQISGKRKLSKSEYLREELKNIIVKTET